MGGWGDGQEKREEKCIQVVKLKEIFFLFVKFLSKSKIAIVKEIQFPCQVCVYQSWCSIHTFKVN